MESAVKIPLSERINVRMIIFGLVVLCIIGAPVYIYLDAAISGGIHDRGEYTEVDLKAMSNFPFDQVNGKITDIPPQWRALDGKRIAVTGEIWANNTAGDNLRNFEVVYSIAKCCFNGPPQIQHFVAANVKNGTVTYASGMVQVTGILHVNVERSEEKVTRVYTLDVEKAEPR